MYTVKTDYIRCEYDVYVPTWIILNACGEPCYRAPNIIMRFQTFQDAEKYCAQLNQCPDGGLITALY